MKPIAIILALVGVLSLGACSADTAAESAKSWCRLHPDVCTIRE